MKNNFRSCCPLASTLDILGDKWSLLIIRDMLFQGSKTFKEFMLSPEGFVPGILSTRLKWLEENQFLSKRKLPHNLKENTYLLTDKGIELAPILVEIILWSDKHLREQNPVMYQLKDAGLDQDKSKVIRDLQLKYLELRENILTDTLLK